VNQDAIRRIKELESKSGILDELDLPAEDPYN
jgi:hypothetical protein